MASTQRQRTTTRILSGGAAALLAIGAWAAWAGQGGQKDHFGPGQGPPRKETARRNADGPRPGQAHKPAAGRPPKIDLVFALDTTGSMSGLLDGAKRKIWGIANQVVSGQPRPEVRVGLVAYRDHGDEYVTQVHPLTKDMDSVHETLLTFQANGGGDTPEHVNRALADAVRQMGWGEGQEVLRLLFLVGDAPPQEGRDGLTSAAVAAEARAKGVVVNAIRCGEDPATEVVWKAIAGAAGGKFASIAQDGGVVAAVATPFDARLAELNRTIADDGAALAFGGADKKAETTRKLSRRFELAAPAAAAAASFGAKAGRLDSGDLVTALMEGGVADLDALPEEALPAAVAQVPKPARKAYMADRTRARKALEGEVLTLSKKRDTWLREEEARAGGPKKDAFDTNVLDMLRDQAASVGVAY